MNYDKLKEAEAKFFMQYPGGFSNPIMLDIAKRHKVEKMTKLAKDSFSIEQFDQPETVVEAMIKVVSQSSMVSVFEKPKFRDAVRVMSGMEKERIVMGLKEFLHGNQELGFNLITNTLAEYKIAKWPVITIFGVYYNPAVEVFVKPTTAKGIIDHFEFEGLKYGAKPTYSFYKAYRGKINTLKKGVDPSLQKDNAGFCGFLMVSIGNEEG